ncbi:hypothetical protein [Bacillus sp. 7894-2]|uniref:hypothetical protein n=1 Tax=Bacillus sp. 7894-2 TaxID=2021695 RepID=UPI000BA6675C|nr:hypothetical protein [Bacillus sp. 7894-2]PAE24016.1 hypothetical protein CHI10_14520 [Bacillus sp. 7894-2]
MKRLLIGLVSAVASFAAVRWARKEKKFEEGFEWIDADDGTELKPAYSPGGKVLTWNPYTEDYVDYDIESGPFVYIIESVQWDDEDSCYRYKLRHNDDLIAECWLIELEYPTMTVWGEETESSERGAMEMSNQNGKQVQPKGHRAAEKAEVARRKAWAKRADELLDIFNEYTKEGDVEAAEATMKLYKSEQALFNAGTAIREAGGDLGGERPEPELIEEDGA